MPSAQPSAHPGAPRGRCAASTREALLVAASIRFGRYGYDGTSVRDIARDAGVDAALVYRYFGSKDGLFRLVSAKPELFEPLLEIPLAEVPDWICDFATRTPPDGADSSAHPILTVLRSPSREEAVERFRQDVAKVFTERFAARLTGDDAQVRAELVAAWMLGSSLMYKAFRTPALTGAEPELLRAHIRAGVSQLLGLPDGEAEGGGCPAGLD